MKSFVYADNAATTPMSGAALAAMTPYFQDQFGNPSSLYAFAQEAKTDLNQARADIARCINAQPQEIFFTSCGTEADNWALQGMAQRKGSGHIITSVIEHHAILHTAQYLEKQGFTVTYLPVDEYGRVNPAHVKEALREDTILISIMAANNEIGTIQSVAEIGAIARAAQVPFHTDAVQAMGHIPVDVEAWNCDMLSFSGHKFGGPRGTGGLYIRRTLMLPPMIHGGGQEKNRRSGTENVAGVVGMAAALVEAVDKLPQEMEKLQNFAQQLQKTILAIPYAKLTGDLENRLPGTTSAVFEGVEGEALLLHLDRMGVCASSGSACSSASLDVSHVLQAIGLPHEVAHGSLRLSLGAISTQSDVDHIIKVVPEVVAYLRDMSPVWDEVEQKPVWY